MINVVYAYNDVFIAGHEGREGVGELRYSSTVSLTSALGSDGWSTPHPGYHTPGNDPVPIVQEAGWAPGWVRKISSPPGFDPGTVQPLASRYTDCNVPSRTGTVHNYLQSW